MRGAFGKPTGLVARVNIGQIIFSVRSKDANKAQVMEGLRRAGYKFPGRQNIAVSNKWGFTKFTREQYGTLKAQGRVIDKGIHIHPRNGNGSLSKGDNVENAVILKA